MGLRFEFSRRISSSGLSSVSNAIAIVSVALSVFVIILAFAISGGFKNEIREKAVGYTGDMFLCAQAAEIIDWKTPITGRDFSGIIGNISEIRKANPVYYRFGLIKTTGEIQGVLFKGVKADYDTTFFAKHLVAGRLPDFLKESRQQDKAAANAMSGYSNEILISRRLADILGYKVGEKVIAYFIGDDIKVRKFLISGLYDAQLEDFDKITILVDANQIIALNGWNSGEVSGYEIRMGNATNVMYSSNKYLDILEKTKNKVVKAVEEVESDNDQSINVVTVTESSQVLFDWLKLLDMNVVIILALMIAVAGFNMVSGLLIILFEKVSTIGLLKSLGMKTLDIVIIFLYKAGSLVLKGLAIGNILAAIFCILENKYGFITLNPENYFVESVPISISPITFLEIDIIAFVAIMLILILPCHFITGVNPAKTLKFE